MSELKVKWPFIVYTFDKIYFNRIDLGNYTMFRMCLFKTCTPKMGMYVSIEHKGSFFFSMYKALHKDYVSEKLCLQGDHGQMADFLNAQLRLDEFGQQGNYYIDVINSIEPYGSIVEDKIMPWHPEIINE